MKTTRTVTLPAGCGYWAEYEGHKQFGWAMAFRRAKADTVVTIDGLVHLGCARFTFENGDVGWSAKLFKEAVAGGNN